MRVVLKSLCAPTMLSLMAMSAGCEAPTARPERVTEADIITPESAARMRGGNIGIRSAPDEEIASAEPTSALVEMRTNDLFVAGSSAIVTGARASLAERVASLPPGAAITIEVTPEPALATSTPRTNDLEQARANALRKFLESEAGGRWPVRAAVGTMSGPERRVVIRSDAPVAAPTTDSALASTPSVPASMPAAETIATTAPAAEPAPVPAAAPAAAVEPAAIVNTPPSAPSEPATAAMPAPLSTPSAEPARVASTPPTPPPARTPPAPTVAPAAATPAPAAIARRTQPAPPPPPPPARDEGVILASGGIVEFAGAEIFEAGTFVLTAEAPTILKKRLTALSKRRPIVVQAFNDEKSKNTKRSTRATRELSQVRADALAEYLRSPEGGGWTVERAVGRAFDVVDDREPDRRVEIIQTR